MYTTLALHLTSDLELSEVVLNSPNVMLLLEHFNIHVPLHEKTIREVCAEKKISLELFLTIANLYNGTSYSNPVNFSFGELPVIIDFLKNSHRYYMGEIYPNIQNIIKQMYELTHEEMALVEKFFNEYFKEVAEHLEYENQIAFPYMINLYEHIVNKKPYAKSSGYQVLEYKDHHNDIEEKLDDLKNLLVKYLPGRNDQQLRRKLFFSLVELDYDLQVHAKIEDLILIPLVEQMENYLIKG
jgi:regulator of cell morphogenesis and NO signaling